MICKIENCQFENESQRSFIHHIKHEHNINSLEEYFNDFEAVSPVKCEYCNNEASWNDKTHLYRKVCHDKKCIGKYAHSIAKENNFKNFGITNVSQLQKVRDKIDATKFQRYGSSHYNNIDKNKQTCLERYNVDNGSKTQESKEKISKKYNESNKENRKQKTIETNQLKYNVDWNSQSIIMQEHRKESNLSKYGVEHPMQNKEFYEKRKSDFLEKFGYAYITQIPDVRAKISSTNYEKSKQQILNIFKDVIVGFPEYGLVTIKCPVCKQESTMPAGFMMQRNKFTTDICLHCTPYNIPSYVQIQLSKWIEGLGIEVKNNYKIPGSQKEIDIFIPEKNIGFEFNGIYWHSDKFQPKFSHKNKKMLGINAGINIITIWEDDYHGKWDIIASKIKNSVGLPEESIGARKCQIKNIDNKTAKEFISSNHIQGFINAKICIGLYYKDELVSVISFGRRNGLKENEWEILRFCSKLGYNVQGAFSKLIKHFKEIYMPTVIVTYIDLDWCNYRNNVYEKNGFEFVSETEPGYTYTTGKYRESRQKYQKHKLVKEGYDINKTESVIMSERGYYKVWNCGNLKYKWTRKQ